MRKTLCLFSCLLLGIIMTACGREEESQTQTDSAAVSERVETESSEQPEKIVSEEAMNDSLQKPVMEQTNETNSEDNTVTKMNVQVGIITFLATLESNIAVNEFVQMMQEAPVVLNMSDYSGFEKVGTLETNLTTSNSQTNTQAGDIVLYNGNQIVIFYDSHSWTYTRLAKIDDLSGWAEALGNGDVQVTFSVLE